MTDDEDRVLIERETLTQLDVSVESHVRNTITHQPSPLITTRDLGHVLSIASNHSEHVCPDKGFEWMLGSTFGHSTMHDLILVPLIFPI